MSISLDTPRHMRYLTIADKLRHAILDGTLPAGARLPGQRELAEQHHTALMTVRQALALLEAEGLVRFEHGVGTFVTDSGLDPDALHLASFGEMNPSAVQTVLHRAEAAVQAPAAAQLLGLSPETPLGLLERLRLLEGRPIVYQQSFLPPALADLVAGFCPERSLYRQIQSRFSERAAISRETLQP
ncbi:MAG TPA: GntR family transcriptional regulator, partial [Caldilineaceae bacterium]|nr:GntR family transcriptional regulator [Caldilineaceae bacterium]